MKNPSITFIVISLLLFTLFNTVISVQYGIYRGRMLEGIERINASVALADKNHRLTMRIIDHKFRLDQCRSWAIWKTKTTTGGYSG